MLEPTDIRYNFAKRKANISSHINLDNIDKKLSNNQLVCVLEYTWQKAVTKYQKNKIIIVSIITNIIIFILKYFKTFSTS